MRPVRRASCDWKIMTENRYVKKAVRARMAATKEPYSVALNAYLEEQNNPDLWFSFGPANMRWSTKSGSMVIGRSELSAFVSGVREILPDALFMSRSNVEMTFTDVDAKKSRERTDEAVGVLIHWRPRPETEEWSRVLKVYGPKTLGRDADATALAWGAYALVHSRAYARFDRRTVPTEPAFVFIEDDSLWVDGYGTKRLPARYLKAINEGSRERVYVITVVDDAKDDMNISDANRVIEGARNGAKNSIFEPEFEIRFGPRKEDVWSTQVPVLEIPTWRINMFEDYAKKAGAKVIDRHDIDMTYDGCSVLAQADTRAHEYDREHEHAFVSVASKDELEAQEEPFSKVLTGAHYNVQAEALLWLAKGKIDARVRSGEKCAPLFVLFNDDSELWRVSEYTRELPDIYHEVMNQGPAAGVYLVHVGFWGMVDKAAMEHSWGQTPSWG